MRRVVALVLSLGLLLAPSAAPAEPSAPGSSWSPRPAEYPSSVTESNVAIQMSDGLELRGDIVRPVDESGDVVDEPLPVVVTITAYNKSALSAAGFGGGEADYLVSRGYVRLTVDARGTGNSPGVWQVFGEREQLDAKEVVEWAAQQPWSDSSSIAPIALAGLCSRSATQWTAGITNQFPFPNPCNTDNALNDRLGVVFETEPLTEPLHMLGPIAARLYASSTTGDGLLSVHVSRVQPDGRVERLTGGWQVMSLAALDEEKSVKLGDEIVQPWHPFTRDSRRVRAPGEITPVDVEVFPTGAVINPGDRLRISVQTFDLPHLAPTLEQLPGALGVMTIHNSPEHPSRLVVPDLAGEAPPVSEPGGADDSGLVGAIEDALGGAAGLPVAAGAESEKSWPARVADALLPATGSPMSGVLILAAVALVLGGLALRLRRPEEPPSA